MPDGAPLDYAPNNEQGVVYLFSHVARKQFGLRVERVQAGFPDCLAYKDGRRVRIEFEYRSRNFLQHRHDPLRCDWIVCWIHDWPAAPARLRVIELRREFGLGFNVWICPVGPKYFNDLSAHTRGGSWSMPSQASEGDLLLYHRTRPEACIRDIFRVDSPVGRVRAGWKPGKDWMASTRRVATLGTPLHFSALVSDPVLREAGFVRGKMRTRSRVTQHWPELHRMILDRNPALEQALRSYGPERIV